MTNIDFVIEVYTLSEHPYGKHLAFLYREIPVGTTVNTFSRPPDFEFKGKLKPSVVLPLDYPVRQYVLTHPKNSII